MDKILLSTDDVDRIKEASNSIIRKLTKLTDGICNVKSKEGLRTSLEDVILSIRDEVDYLEEEYLSEDQLIG